MGYELLQDFGAGQDLTALARVAINGPQFKGIGLYHRNQQQTEDFILVVRGTADHQRDWTHSNLGIYLGDTNHVERYRCAEAVLKWVKARYPRSQGNLTVVGHSLGG